MSEAETKADPVEALLGYIESLHEAGEDGGDLMGWYTRGHVERLYFAQAVNLHNQLTLGARGYDKRWCNPEKVQHVWWRTVPIGAGLSSFQEADPGSRGAWKATVHYIDADSLQRDLWRMKQTHLQRVYGFAGGVNWAANALRYQFPEAEKFLVERWRANPPDEGRETLDPEMQRRKERAEEALRKPAKSTPGGP